MKSFTLCASLGNQKIKSRANFEKIDRALEMLKLTTIEDKREASVRFIVECL